MSVRGHETRTATPDRTDDEKTIREERFSNDLPKERPVGDDDQEKAAKSRPDSEIVTVTQEDPVPSADDDFPDGGLKAWSVVIGVSELCSRRGHNSVDIFEFILVFAWHIRHIRIRQRLGSAWFSSHFWHGAVLMFSVGVPGVLRANPTEHDLTIDNVRHSLQISHTLDSLTVRRAWIGSIQVRLHHLWFFRMLMKFTISTRWSSYLV